MKKFQDSYRPTGSALAAIVEFAPDFVPADSFDWNHLMELRSLLTRKTGIVIVIDYEEVYVHPSKKMSDNGVHMRTFKNDPSPIKALGLAIYMGIIWTKQAK